MFATFQPPGSVTCLPCEGRRRDVPIEPVKQMCLGAGSFGPLSIIKLFIERKHGRWLGFLKVLDIELVKSLVSRFRLQELRSACSALLESIGVFALFVFYCPCSEEILS